MFCARKMVETAILITFPEHVLRARVRRGGWSCRPGPSGGKLGSGKETKVTLSKALGYYSKRRPSLLAWINMMENLCNTSSNGLSIRL
jgi:hypothetical protein